MYLSKWNEDVYHVALFEPFQSLELNVTCRPLVVFSTLTTQQALHSYIFEEITDDRSGSVFANHSQEYSFFFFLSAYESVNFRVTKLLIG